MWWCKEEAFVSSAELDFSGLDWRTGGDPSVSPAPSSSCLRTSVGCSNRQWVRVAVQANLNGQYPHIKSNEVEQKRENWELPLDKSLLLDLLLFFFQ